MTKEGALSAHSCGTKININRIKIMFNIIINNNIPSSSFKLKCSNMMGIFGDLWCEM